MRRRLSFLLSAGLVTAALAAGGTAAAVPAKGAHGAAKGGAEKSAHDRIVDYWTAERRANAIPRDVVLPSTRAKGGKPGKPGGGGGGGGTGTGDVTGATWTDPNAPVALTTGKVYFKMGEVHYVCSGSAIAGSVNLVLTAGHCVWDDADEFATEWMFWPGYDNGISPKYGEWTATSLFATEGWHGSAGPQGNDFPNDAGLAVVTNNSTDPASDDLSEVLGTLPQMAFPTDPGAPLFSAFGYPAAKKYKGQTLIYCQGPVATTYDTNNTVSMACDMTGGSSGGPWYQGALNNKVITSLNSYGYNGLNRMFGPTFDGPETTLRNQAADGTCDQTTETCTKIPAAG